LYLKILSGSSLYSYRGYLYSYGQQLIYKQGLGASLQSSLLHYWMGIKPYMQISAGVRGWLKNYAMSLEGLN
jgi:hypothetical protein